MEKLRARLQVSFSTKVLVPVVAILVLLPVITVWLVNRRLTDEFENAAVRSLAHADGEFQNSQKLRTKVLVQRFRNLRNEPRYKAVLQSGGSLPHLPTLINTIEELPDDQGLDIA